MNVMKRVACFFQKSIGASCQNNIQQLVYVTMGVMEDVVVVVIRNFAQTIVITSIDEICFLIICVNISLMFTKIPT